MHARADDVRDNIIILLDECLTLLASSANLPVVFKVVLYGKAVGTSEVSAIRRFFKSTESSWYIKTT